MPEVLIIDHGKHTEKGPLRNPYVNFIVGWLVYAILVVTRIVCKIYYRNAHQKLPKIEDVVITESVEALAEKIRNKEISSEQLINAYIKRIRQVNGILNCVVQDRFAEALKEAKAADELVRGGSISTSDLKKNKPLLGVPFSTKDAIMVKGMQQTCGLVSRKDIVGETNAEAIGNLRSAGAIPIALTNVPELCMWWESYNKLFGRTKNAYDNSRSVGGSSGGEGCIQSVAGSAFGVGSDIGGSIRIPALCNGIFGHKPSKYVVSTVGHVPKTIDELQESMLGLGPMCRRASDLKFLLKLMVKKEALDKLRLDEPVDLRHVKVFYQTDDGGNPLVSAVDDSIATALRDAITHFDSLSATRPRAVRFSKFFDAMYTWSTCMNMANFSSDVRAGMGVRGTVAELFKSLLGRSDHCFMTLVNCLVFKTYPRAGSEGYERAVRARDELERELVATLGRDGVLLCPTNATGATYHNEAVARGFSVAYTSVVSALGVPATHAPAGFDRDGLPIGLQIVAAFDNDRLCLAVAEELERAFGGWRDPARAKNNN